MGGHHEAKTIKWWKGEKFRGNIGGHHKDNKKNDYRYIAAFENLYA
jgi:hypothetical protein